MIDCLGFDIHFVNVSRGIHSDRHLIGNTHEQTSQTRRIGGKERAYHRYSVQDTDVMEGLFGPNSGWKTEFGDTNPPVFRKIVIIVVDIVSQQVLLGIKDRAAVWCDEGGGSGLHFGKTDYGW